MAMWVWITIAISTLIVCLVVGRHHYDRRVGEWRALFKAGIRQELARTQDFCEMERDVVGWSFTSARAKADRVEAARLLRASYDYISGVQAGRMARLRAMGIMVRMALAVAPAPAVPWRQFRLRSVRAAAGGLGLLHFVLVSPAERFALRVYVVTIGFGLVLRVLARSSRRVTRMPANEAAWDAYGLGVEDWKALDAEHLAAAVHLVESSLSTEEPPAATKPAAKRVS